jgi:LacI family transcriptional regulator
VLGEMVSTGSDEARSSGAELVFIKVSPDLQPTRMRRTIANFGLEGVILPPPLADDARLRNALSADGIRLVTIAADDNRSTHSSIRIDDRRAAYRLTRDLLDIGHRRIGFIGGARHHRSSARRRAGYEEALLEKGLAPDPSLYWEGEYTYASALVAAEAALERMPRPTAIFAANDDMAAAVISVALRHGISVPGDLTVCGFDDSEIALMVSPQLTTVCQPVGAMVRWAVRQLVEELSAIERGEQPEICRVVIHHRIVHRGSEAPPRNAERGTMLDKERRIGFD